MRPSAWTSRSPRPDWNGVAVDVRFPVRPIRRVRVHAPRPCRRAGIGDRRGSDRRVPDAAPHEPGRRCHGACHFAGSRGRFPGVRAQPVRHDRRRLDSRLRRCLSDRVRRAHDRAQGGRRARHFLSAFACARCDHRFAQGHQHRSTARIVRLRARARRSDVGADRRQCDPHPDRAGPDLPAAGDRVRRSRVHALSQPCRRAVPSRLPCAGGDQPGLRLPRAGDTACGRHHDAAGGDRAFLGARHQLDDRARRRQRRRSRAMPGC